MRSLTLIRKIILLACPFCMICGPVHAQTLFTLSVPAYNSPTFTNTLGSGHFTLSGRNTPISLSGGIPLTVFLDDSVSVFSSSLPTNSDPPVTVSDTALTSLTLGGISQNVPFNYTFTPAGQRGGNVLFAAAPSVAFAFAAGSLTVTPLSGFSSRVGSFLFTPAAVPEPGSVALLIGVAMSGAFSVIRRRNVRAA